MNISSPLLPSPYTCVRILSDPSQHGPGLCVSVRVPFRMFFVFLKRLLLLLRLTINKHSQLEKKNESVFFFIAFCLSFCVWAGVYVTQVYFYTNVHICDTLAAGCAHMCTCIYVCICMYMHVSETM